MRDGWYPRSTILINNPPIAISASVGFFLSISMTSKSALSSNVTWLIFRYQFNICSCLFMQWLCAEPVCESYPILLM